MPHAIRRPRPARRAGLAALSALLALAAAAVLVNGCGSDKHVAPIVTGPQLPAGTPPSTSPDSTVVRWLTAYAWGVEKEADTLLTANFHYVFSMQTDPSLYSFYGTTGWGKANEAVSLHHLWTGFTNNLGSYIPAVTSIHFQATGISVFTDTAHTDSSAWYKRVHVTVLSLAVESPLDGGTYYDIQMPADVFVARGDAAVLGKGQKPDPTRWYVREVDDLATPYGVARQPATNAMPLPARAATWGALRAQYL